MSKFIQTAALVVGAVALAATGIGAAASAGIIGTAAASGAAASTATFLGVSAATFSTIGTFGALAAAGLGAIASLTAHAPSSSGSPTSWSANPDAGIPIMIGYTANDGQIVYRRAYGDKGNYETLVTVISLGPIQSIDGLFVDKKVTAVGSGGLVDISDRGKMYQVSQLGACPEASALITPPATPDGWTSAHKLSGLAATGVTFIYDSNGSHTFTSTPECGWVGHGVKCYDPRADSTYPGGLGSQRIADETTWAWSANPYVVGLTWCIGWRQNGKLAAGVGLPVSGLVLDQFVEGANVADANGWKVGGVVYTTDDKWDVLKDILQAGGGEPIRLGALVGCLIDTPRVSLATITEADVLGDVSVTAMQARRDRINAIVPRYRDEESQWAIVPAAPIIVNDYVTADGRQRRKEVSYPLVQRFTGAPLTQVGQRARYDIENAREFGPITMPLKLRWMGYKPGDCVTVHLPECGLANQLVLLTNRSLDAGSAVVSMTARSETAGKHPFALGQTATPSAAPALSAGYYDQIKDLLPSRGTYLIVLTDPAFPITSNDTSISIAANHATLEDAREYDFPAGSATGLTSGTRYGVFWDFASSTYQVEAFPAATLSANSETVFFGFQDTSNAGSFPTPTPPPPGYGGGGGVSDGRGGAYHINSY